MAKQTIKPQSPMYNGDAYILPLTTADQVIKSNGQKLEVNGNIDADTLGGKSSLAYVSKEEINEKMPFRFGVDENGNYGYIKEGADTVTPFNKDIEIWILFHATSLYKLTGFSLKQNKSSNLLFLSSADINTETANSDFCTITTSTSTYLMSFTFKRDGVIFYSENGGEMKSKQVIMGETFGVSQNTMKTISTLIFVPN